MKHSFSRALFILSLLATVPVSAPSQNNPSPTISPIPLGEKLKLSGVPNAGRINDSLFRGAQPLSQGITELKKLGITTIVDLRGEDPDKIKWEQQQAESVGMHFVNIPVSGWSPPTNDQVAQFLSLFKNHNDKIFVHCRFGDDRTGVFVAAYRMAHDHWLPHQAIKEMYFFGFNGFWHPAMKSYIDVFPDRLKTAPALAPFEKSM
ncbi:MAG TPA: dual specificity protein phosphatase family protein [Candidatus Dormibacteraeota bacterium]|nr:dual specificity protein phosphatase family protein [Candidatus Dormibacteraeota bacterium]